MVRFVTMDGEIKIARLEEMLSKASERRLRAEQELRAATEDEVALRRVLEMVGVDVVSTQENETESGESAQTLPGHQSDSNPRIGLSTNGHVKKIRLTKELRNLLPQIEGRFQPPDVTRWLQEKFPYADIRHQSVSGAVWRMADRGEGIRKVEDGYGSEPNTYEKIPQDDETQKDLEEQEDFDTEETTVSE